MSALALPRRRRRSPSATDARRQSLHQTSYAKPAFVTAASACVLRRSVRLAVPDIGDIIVEPQLPTLASKGELRRGA